MKIIIASMVLAIAVTGCSRPAPKSDEYFESITPQSQALQENERRLRDADEFARQNQNAVISDETPSSEDGSTTQDLIEQAESELAQEEAAPAAVPIDNSVVSDADDFEAIQQVETVRSEQERVQELGKTYKTFDPKALPTRKSGVDLDAYATKYRNRKVGKSRYRRKGENYTQNFCEQYVDMELAQVSFISQGGPKADPLLLDPDGDGFACGWTPQGHALAKTRSTARLDSPQ